MQFDLTNVTGKRRRLSSTGEWKQEKHMETTKKKQCHVEAFRFFQISKLKMGIVANWHPSNGWSEKTVANVSISFLVAFQWWSNFIFTNDVIFEEVDEGNTKMTIEIQIRLFKYIMSVYLNMIIICILISLMANCITLETSMEISFAEQRKNKKKLEHNSWIGGEKVLCAMILSAGEIGTRNQYSIWWGLPLTTKMCFFVIARERSTNQRANKKNQTLNGFWFHSSVVESIFSRLLISC